MDKESQVGLNEEQKETVPFTALFTVLQGPTSSPDGKDDDGPITSIAPDKD